MTIERLAAICCSGARPLLALLCSGFGCLRNGDAKRIISEKCQKSVNVPFSQKRELMAILDPIYAMPLAIQLIPQVERTFADRLKLTSEQRSIGLISAD